MCYVSAFSVLIIHVYLVCVCVCMCNLIYPPLLIVAYKLIFIVCSFVTVIAAAAVDVACASACMHAKIPV